MPVKIPGYNRGRDPEADNVGRYLPRLTYQQEMALARRLLKAWAKHGSLHKAALALSVPVWTAYRLHRAESWRDVERAMVASWRPVRGAGFARPILKIDPLLL